MTRAKFLFNRQTGFNQIRIGEQDESVVEFDVDAIRLTSGSIIEYYPEDPSQWSAVPTNLIQAVDYLAAGSGSGGGGGGGGSPGGANGDIQYKVNATTFGGVSKIRFVGGDVFITGSFLGDVVGTASYATNAENALTASYVLNAISSSFAANALTASYAANADLLDNLDSTAFARLATTNTFAANQVVSGTLTSTLGFSGSLTKLADGSSYLVAGANITITSASNGSVTINGTSGGGTTGAVTTTSQTPQTLVTLTPAANSSVTYEAKVSGRKVSGVAGAGYGLAATFIEDSGTITQVGTTSTLWSHESTAGLDASYEIDGTDVLLKVTGEGPSFIDPVSPPTPGGTTWTVGTLGGENYSDLATALADVSVVNGDKLLLSAQTFNIASTITVSKQVTIEGAGISSTIIQTAADGTAPNSAVNITVSNVTIRDLTIKQRKTPDGSVATGIVLNPGAGSSGHYFETVRIETTEIGITIQSDGWQINNSQLANTQADTSFLCIIYRSDGQGIIANTSFDQGPDTGSRAILIRANNSTPTPLAGANLLGGYLRFTNLSSSVVAQFVNCDSFSESATLLTLVVDNCNMNETSLFVGFILNKANILNFIDSITLYNNSITGTHGGTPVGTKGAVTFDGSIANGAMGSTTFYAANNSAANTTYRTGFATALDTSVYLDALTQSLMGYEPASYDDPNQLLTNDDWDWTATVTTQTAP